MHKYQEELYRLAKSQDLGKLSLRNIAELIKVPDKPQIVKHHLMQLQKVGLIQLNLEEKIIRPVEKGFSKGSSKNIFYSLPVFGSANCGPATMIADQKVEGYLKVSSKMLPHRKQDLYVLVADGLSMNKADINGKNIDDGDFVVVDGAYKNPKNGDIVVISIDGLATIKRYREDKINNQIVLDAESTENFFPIFLHEDDDFVINGKVIHIIKKPN